ncbi:MAG: CDP-glucose 4,6-dehydratase [Nitrosomonadales bacterium]|nr:CDP-glucose 4,6-dehydratase [Nitrosomonadales bacterium]
MNREFWKRKKVFLTGHTGFKGGWLSLWLNELGAEVHGYALEPNTTPNFYTEAGVSKALASSTIDDIRDLSGLKHAMQASNADIVLHLAAQPLVRYSYEAPVETYSTNVMGTVNLFEAVRKTPSVKAVVNVTTDKCYENREWVWPYREDEAMGGYDPYSSSKGCSELVTSAYRRSFLATSGVAVASARAGNVIGGGDWATDRLIPDFLRAIDANQSLVVRSPASIRPWQHVLEPLSGYLLLAERLYSEGDKFSEAWNFGPSENDAQNVEWIVNRLIESIPGSKWNQEKKPHPHEAGYLKLDSSKARSYLEWQPRWNLTIALDKVVSWHKNWHQGESMYEFTLSQIAEYEQSKRNE